MIDPNAASSTNPTKSKCIRQPSDVFKDVWRT